jgi:hypothetical protein
VNQISLFHCPFSERGGHRKGEKADPGSLDPVDPMDPVDPDGSYWILELIHSTVPKFIKSYQNSQNFTKSIEID